MAMSGFICSCMQPRPNQVNASTFIFDLSATIDMAIKTNSSVHKKNEMQFYFNIERTAPTNTHTPEYILYELNCKQTNDEVLAMMNKKKSAIISGFFLFGSKRAFHFNINVT